jgi:glycosyltransferase involved in cell wall biosynthesis
MAATPRCSVIVRTKNEADSIARTLDLLGAQTVEAEVIVVDSGSTDGTVDIVRTRDVRLIEIPADSFTYGGALNTGAEAASAPILVALSAHAFPRDEHWLERLLACFEDEQVAAASGEVLDWDDGPLTTRRVQDLELARRNPYWGYSNAAGAVRAELWRAHPFRTDLPFSEDKEFAWHWLHHGRTVVIDPLLAVDHDHSKDPLPVLYSRARAKWLAFSMYLPMPDYPPSALAREWWSERGSWRSHARARLSHRRAAALLGRYAGLRAGKRLQQQS